MQFSRSVGKKIRSGPSGRQRAVRPAQQLQLTVRLLDQGGAGLDPVAGVAIQGTADVLEVGTVNVPTNHTVVALFPGVSGGDVLELRDVADADGDAQLDPLRNRPVRPLQ